MRAGLFLDDEALERELNAMTDAYTDLIAERAATRAEVRPWLFINGLSRLVVDPERFPDDREEMNAVGMGAVYTSTSGGGILREPTVDEISGLVDRYFVPYADAFTNLVDARLEAVGAVAIVDLHSFPRLPLPYELHGDGPRPEICLGTDPFHTPDFLRRLSEHALVQASPGRQIGANSPFSGCYVPLRHYGKSEFRFGPSWSRSAETSTWMTTSRWSNLAQS